MNQNTGTKYGSEYVILITVEGDNDDDTLQSPYWTSLEYISHDGDLRSQISTPYLSNPTHHMHSAFVKRDARTSDFDRLAVYS